MRLADGASVRVDGHEVPLIPAGLTGPDARSLVLLRDGWRIALTLRLFRPLIFFVACGEDAYCHQLKISLLSLAEMGRYAGHIHIITDRAGAAEAVPEALRKTCSIQRIVCEDRVDRHLARYAIAEWPDAYRFQPLLYADTDVVFNAPVEPHLARAACQGRICAAAESGNLQRVNIASGARLFAADGHDAGDATGVNAGIHTIPSLQEAAPALRLIERVARSARWQDPDLSGLWVDQPAFNYVLTKLDLLDREILRPMVQTPPREGYPPLDQRAGAVHFWPTEGAWQKAAVMAAYLAALRRG